MRKLLIALFLFTSILYAQMTTSSISGSIEIDGVPARKVKLIIKHLPTNYPTETETNNKGDFSIEDLDVGGPYGLTIIINGLIYYRKYEYLNLGENDVKKIEIFTK